MHLRLRRLILIVAVWLITPLGLGADEVKTQSQQQSQEERRGGDPDTDATKAEKPPGEEDATDDDGFPCETTIKCYFVPSEVQTIILRPLEWTTFSIVDVVEHGTKVTRGDTLISMDPRKIDAAIEDLNYEISEAELNLDEKEREQEVSRRSDQLAMEAAERAERQASENLKRFVTQERTERMESLDRSVKSAENRLAYVQEEYNQLKRMYEADDLTEDTEEIVLRRTRDSVESSEYSLDRYLRSRERGMDVELPRKQIELEEALRRATLALEKARITLPNNAARLEIAVEKQRVALDRKRTRLDRLRQDRELMQITAPLSGWVYYGTDRGGKWPDSTQFAASLRQGANAKTHQTLMTVVRDSEFRLQGSVTESQLGELTVGTSGTATLTAFEDVEMPVTLSELSHVPISEGRFTATLAIDAGLPEAVVVVPGMTCSVVFDTESAGESDKS